MTVGIKKGRMIMLESKKRSNAAQGDAESKTATSSKTLTIIGIILCVILVPMLIINCTLILKSFINEDEVPDVGGVLPMIVLTDSMYPDIKSGDLIFCRTLEPGEVEEGMVISFFDPAGNGSAVVTHKVMEIMTDEDGSLSFRTKGINNNTEDKLPVPAENLVGYYSGFRIPLAGNVALFMQTTLGLIVCVVVPFVIIVGLDLMRRNKNEKTQNQDVAALMAELEALKAAQNAQQTVPTSPAEPSEENPTPDGDQS
jgi:signal peptidase